MSDATPTPDAPKGKGGFIKRKIGGIPVWGYLIFVALLGGFLVYRYRTTGSAFGGTTVKTTNAADTYPLVSNTSPMSSNGVSGGGTSTVTQDNNTAWVNRAANGLAGQGNYSALDISNALNDYIKGNSLNAQESLIVNTALTQYGQPPEGLLPVNGATSSSPTAKTLVEYARNPQGGISAVYADGSSDELTYAEWIALGQAPGGAQYTQLTQDAYDAVTHTYTVMPGDTQASIALKFYGNISDAPKVPATLTPGSKITLPA